MHSKVTQADIMLNVTSESRPFEADFEVTVQPVKLGNSDILADLPTKLNHLNPAKMADLSAIIKEYDDLFPDVPGRAQGMSHDVEVGDASPIKQHPYRVGPVKKKIIDEEIGYMLKNKIIEPCSSPWSSPCLLVPKPDGSHRFCTDFRKVNSVTKTDCYPLPRIDMLIDQVGKARYVTKFDLLKGYWQIPLTERAKEISAFSTGSGLFRYLVMPFGMKNSGSTFQRFMDRIVSGLPDTEVYVDDLIVDTEGPDTQDTWLDHLASIRALFDKLREHTLTVNLGKSDFAKATVKYLGHVVGQGQILPSTAKVQAILEIDPPENRKGVLRIIGMVGAYRRFCPNLSTILAPLTNLVSPKTKFEWTDQCQMALNKIKGILGSYPVLVPPDYTKEFRLYVDCSDVGAGAALVQEHDDSIEHPISYYSKKLLQYQRNYSTVEKEALALLLAVKYFDVYLSSSPFPIQIFTDHNPLVFVNRMKNDNQRLLRWSLTLQEYNLIITHIKGKDNILADTLSRV